MQRRNREINIFNMSALDLFASALGAFILLFLVITPYYLKTSKAVMRENTQLKSQLSASQQQSRQLQAENDRLKQQIATLEDNVKFALLGINTKAKSFVVLVDMSGSMKAYASIVRDTANRILEPLEAKHRVQILGYQEGGFRNWQSPYNLADMAAANRQSAVDFVGRLTGQFDGGTPTKAALLEALKYDAEAVLLLTDGNPTDADSAEIVKTVTSQNGGKKEIHAVAIGEYNAQPGLILFLQALAKQNHGAFVGVAE